MSAPPGRPQASHIPLPPRGDLSWLSEAACAGMPTEAFFPRKSEDQQDIVKICLFSCPVRSQCLEYALAAGCDYGVWGGKTQGEREGLRRKIGAA